VVKQLRYGKGTSFETFSGRSEHLGQLINRFVEHRKPSSFEVAATVALDAGVVVVIFAYMPIGPNSSDGMC